MHQFRYSILDSFLNTPRFVQLLYVLRGLWMGIGSGVFHLHFALKEFDSSASQSGSQIIILLSLIGVFGVIFKNFFLNLIFSLLNVLFYAYITLTYFKYDLTSGGGENYLIEMLGAIWLVYQVNHRQKRRKEFAAFIKEE